MRTANAMSIVGGVFAYAYRTALYYVSVAPMYSVGRLRRGLAMAPYVDKHAVRSSLGLEGS